jgi:hypothetical protein
MHETHFIEARSGVQVIFLQSFILTLRLFRMSTNCFRTEVLDFQKYILTS